MPLSVDKPGDPLHRFSGFSASAAQCRPESKGTVEIAGPDPLALPRIRAGYLTDPHDAKVLVAGPDACCARSMPSRPSAAW